MVKETHYLRCWHATVYPRRPVLRIARAQIAVRERRRRAVDHDRNRRPAGRCRGVRCDREVVHSHIHRAAHRQWDRAREGGQRCFGVFLVIPGQVVAVEPAPKRHAVRQSDWLGERSLIACVNIVQGHYVDAILGHLATPEFAALAPQTAKIASLRADLAAVEANRAARRTAEQVAWSALEDSAEAAKRFYNQMHARLTLLFPEDPDFVESCFLDLRGAAPDHGAESRKRALLAVYRARLGAVPRDVSAALDDDLNEARFGKYIELFAIMSADEIAAAIVPAKG